MQRFELRSSQILFPPSGKIVLVYSLGLSRCHHALDDSPIYGTSPLHQHEASSPLGDGQQEEDRDHRLVDHRSQHLPGHRQHHDVT